MFDSNTMSILGGFFEDLDVLKVLMIYQQTRGITFVVGTLRVRKSKNLPDNKIFHAKTFRIRCVSTMFLISRQICVKLENFMFFLGNVRMYRNYQTTYCLDSLYVGYPDSVWIVRTAYRLSGQSRDCPDSFEIIRTVFGLSGLFLDYQGSLWYFQTVSRLSGQSHDCPDSFKIIRTASGLYGQFRNHPDSFLASQTVFSKCMASCKNFSDFCKNFPGNNATTLPWFF